MAREIFDVVSEPRHETYRQLIRTAMQWCSQFLFVDVPSPNFGENDSQFGSRAKALTADLLEHLIDVQRAKSWPGSTIGEKDGVDTYARLYRFRLDARSVEILSRATDHLYAWRQPTLPGDLSLLRMDGEPWLVTMASDDDAYLRLTLEEAERVLERVPGLVLRRHYRQ